ncbi:MAG: peptidoglycan editing factor PgeF [Pseudomonadota bacterium]
MPATGETPKLTHPSLEKSPSIRHGFFGSEGGSSSGIYATLNCGLGSDDDQSSVAENRRRVAQTMDVPDQNLLSLYQIHSATAVYVRDVWTRETMPRADATVTDQPNIALAISTADCAPVLFADEAAGVIGAAHAGWRGAFDGVVESTVQAMEQLGAVRERISAVVGPCISQPSYEVGAEFKQRFVDHNPSFAEFFTDSPDPEKQKSGHVQFNLPKFVLHRLGEAGLANRVWVDVDTRMNAGSYFSYRRTTLANEPDYGRQLSVIVLA